VSMQQAVTVCACVCVSVRCVCVCVQEVSTQAITELAERDMSNIRNRSAYIMGILKRLRQEQCTH
jgi:hypothetical protein